MAICTECGFEEPTSQWESLPSAHGGTLLPCKRCQVIKMEYNRLDSIAGLEKRIAAGTYQSRDTLDQLIAEGSRLARYEQNKVSGQERIKTMRRKMAEDRDKD